MIIVNCYVIQVNYLRHFTKIDIFFEKGLLFWRFLIYLVVFVCKNGENMIL